MKILQLSYEIYPVVGGTSTLIKYLMEGMEGKDCEIHLVTKTIDPNHPPVIKVAASYIYTIYSEDAEETKANIETKTQVRFIRKIKEIVNSGVKFDLIHVHDALPVDLVPYLKKIFDIPILMSYHINHHILKEQARLNGDSDILKNSIALELEKKGAQLCDYFMSASQATKQWLVNYYGIAEEKISVVPYGINLQNYPEEIDCEKIINQLGKDDHKIILYAGRFVLQKGIDYLIETFEKVLKEIPNAKLVLIGEGKKEEEIRSKLTLLGTDCFEILKKMPFEELPPYYRSADVVVMPSIFEPFGMVSIEGMASKAIMIVSKIDGLGEIIIDGYNGFAIPVNEEENGFRWIDNEILKNIIIEGLTNTDKTGEMRNNARKHVIENYSAKRFAEGMYSAYTTLLNKFNEDR
jgi:glycogen synthase